MADYRDPQERPKAAAEEAEKRIEEASRTGAPTLDLSLGAPEPSQRLRRIAGKKARDQHRISHPDPINALKHGYQWFCTYRPTAIPPYRLRQPSLQRAQIRPQLNKPARRR